MRRKSQRLYVYKELLKIYNRKRDLYIEKKWYIGFCRLFDILNIEKARYYGNIEEYPELMKYKPKKTKKRYFYSYWFNPLNKSNKRKRILEEIISQMQK